MVAVAAKPAAGGQDKKGVGAAAAAGAAVGGEKKRADKVEAERKPLQHDEPTSDEWATGTLGRPAGDLDVKEWGQTFYTAPP
jgi:lysyl-tRNA synthetase class 2